MTLLQGPEPPMPPIGPHFDPNLLFMNDSKSVVLIVIAALTALTIILWPIMRAFARRLVVPQPYYGAARRLLRDKISAHDIRYTGKTLDLGVHDERDDV